MMTPIETRRTQHAAALAALARLNDAIAPLEAEDRQLGEILARTPLAPLEEIEKRTRREQIARQIAPLTRERTQAAQTMQETRASLQQGEAALQGARQQRARLVPLADPDISTFVALLGQVLARSDGPIQLAQLTTYHALILREEQAIVELTSAEAIEISAAPLLPEVALV